MAQNESTKHFAAFRPNQLYHIYNRGIDGTPVFSSDRNKDFFLQRISIYLLPYVDLWAWVLMRNHFHFLIRIKQIEEDFRKAVAMEGTIQALRFEKNGKLQDFLVDQFKRIHIRSNAYAMNCIHYIHHNPVHHGFVAHPADW